MIIGISGKIGSGKDTIGLIINYLTLQYLKHNPQYELQDYIEDMDFNEERIGKNKKKKFADALKNIVCILLGCTRKQLEDREFKEKELGEEWWYYKLISQNETPKEISHKPLFTSYEEALEFKHWYCSDKSLFEPVLIKLTPRLLLQLLGTDCGRNIIHPNIWVNALMSEYKNDYEWSIQIQKEQSSKIENFLHKPNIEEGFPNWIITDMRFPNELKAVKDRGGISIRVNRIEKGKIYKIQDKNTKEILGK